MGATLILENAQVKATFKLKGAELSSLIHKGNGIEYVWQADPQVWGRHAPVLFPIVGKLKEDTYKFDDEIYALSQHGFARDREFVLVDKASNQLKFSLTFSEHTYQHYPFKFELIITYTLKGTLLGVSYEVYNKDEKPLLFSIGAHPGFRCPLTEKEKFEDYYLEFDEIERLERYLLTNGIFNGTKELVMDNTNILPLSYDLFEKDAIVFKKFKSTTVSLKSTKTLHGIKMSFHGFPYLGIWTKEKGAPFICLEPWYGLADTESTSGKLVEKEGIMNLDAGEDFDCHYEIELF